MARKEAATVVTTTEAPSTTTVEVAVETTPKETPTKTRKGRARVEAPAEAGAGAEAPEPVFYGMQDVAEGRGLSLRKIAAGLELNYNMLLKAGKKPVEGQAYNPEFINWEAVAGYIARKKDFSTIDWDALTGVNPQANVVIPDTLSQGTVITLRGEEQTYTIHLMTGTHVILLPSEGTQPRLFSNATFMHQGPKAI